MTDEPLCLSLEAPLFLAGELCGVAKYNVDVTGILTEAQLDALVVRIHEARARATKKVSTEAADFLRKHTTP